jgi:uroporphyrinogen decarboxylase
MTKQERVLAAIQGRPVDVVPYSIWYHFGTQFLPGDKAAEVVIAFYERYDLDFLKVMNDYAYPLPDGLDRIRSITDWKRLRPLKSTEGGFVEQLKLLTEVAKRLEGEALFVDTVFDPFYVARRTAKDIIFELLRSHPEEFKQGLGVITESVCNYVNAVLEIGAAGIFLAVNGATTDFFTRDAFCEFVKPYGIRVLEAIQDKALFNIVHIHGENILFDEILDYPLHALSWEHLHTPPSLAEARQKTDVCLIGGIDEKHPNHAHPDELEMQVEDALRETHGEKFILAPGCSLPTDMPVEQIDLIYKAIRSEVKGER